MSPVEMQATVDLILKILGGLSAFVTAVTLGYARVAAKRSKEAVQQTQSSTHVDGKVKTRSAAATAEEALKRVLEVTDLVERVRGDQLKLAAEVAKLPGTGARRAEDTGMIRRPRAEDW